MRAIRKAVSQMKSVHIEELYDHFMCVFEDLMNKGMDSDDAISEVLSRIENYHQTQQKNRKKEQLKSIVMITSIFAAISFSFLFIFQEPPSHFPVAGEQYKISSGFGMRSHPISKKKKMHNGIDIVASPGTIVMASGEGTVVAADFDEKLGYFIEIRHDAHYSSRYHHLGKILVEKGSKVKAGQHIGEVGSSGLSTGPHLHYEVLKNGKKIDPKPYLGV